MTTFRHFATRETGDEIPPLHWRRVLNPVAEGLNHQPAGVTVAAIVSCRNGHASCLRIGGESRFSIDAAGVVQPSIQCGVSGCNGHEPQGSVLEGW